MNEANQTDIAIEANEAAEITPKEKIIIDEVKTLMAQGKINDNIIFQKVDQKRLKCRTTNRDRSHQTARDNRHNSE